MTSNEKGSLWEANGRGDEKLQVGAGSWTLIYISLEVEPYFWNLLK